jgi:hypothetical protein
MSVEIRPAIPGELPRVVAFKARRERLVRFLATTVTVVTALLAVMAVSTAAVLLGLN